MSSLLVARSQSKIPKLFRDNSKLVFLILPALQCFRVKAAC